MKDVISPVDCTMNAVFIENISVSDISKIYLDYFGIRVIDYFKNLEYISIYQCPSTSYRFYYPLNLGGDGFFYSQLQKYAWYYMPWKWEHEQALKYIKPGMKVLEVGCGFGGFINEVGNRIANIDIIGLELNKDVIEKASSEGLTILPEMIEQHASKYPDTYDIVCSFQVLEHISELNSFIDSNLKAVKIGGYLIIAVPNNDSFIKYDRERDALNMPPHHMGLWNPKSLKELANFFPMMIKKQINEPLQEYHRNWYVNVVESRIQKMGKISKIIYRRLRLQKLLYKFLVLFPSLIDGHTTIAIYQKR